MKIPKKIRMFGFNWKVEVDKNKEGGEYIWKTKKIIVGSKYREQDKALFHEIMEAVLVDEYVRYYTNEGNSPYVFILNHDKFCIFVKRFYEILKDNKII